MAWHRVGGGRIGRVNWAGYLTSLSLSFLVAEVGFTVHVLQQNKPSQNSVALNDNHLLLLMQLWVTGAQMTLAGFSRGEFTSYCRSVSQQDGSAPRVSRPPGISGKGGACCSHGVGRGARGKWRRGFSQALVLE